jgi:hypothetical protein
MSPLDRKVWIKTEPGCTLEFSTTGEMIKVISTPDLEAKAGAPNTNWPQFAEVTLTIKNKSRLPIKVVPQTFVLGVEKPKFEVLRFEYPNRVYYELMDLMLRRAFTPEFAAFSAARADAFKSIAAIPRDALKQSSIAPGDSVEGKVYFEEPSKRMTDVSLFVFVEHTSFQIPFTLRR